MNISLKKLKWLFTTSQLSIAEIALRTKIDYSTLTRILSGNTIKPRPETLNSLAEYFGIDVYELYENDIEQELQNINGKNIIHLKNIREVLSYLLIKKGILNTTVLSKDSGIPKANLDRILSGDTEKPHNSTVDKLARYFKINVTQLFGLQPIVEAIELVTQINITVPILPLNSIKEFINSNPGTKLFAYSIVDSSLEPDFNKNSNLIIDSSAIPSSNKFIIAELNNHATICEFYGEKNEIVVVRKAGAEEIIKISMKDYNLCGVVIQEVYNAVTMI